jgi:hypothetical protein
MAIAAAAVFPKVGAAAPSGLAWDSVTKMVMNGDPSALQPGSFSDDYAAASAPQSQPPGGGLLGGIMHGMKIGQNVGAMMHNGLAEKHYVAGAKERTDQVAQQTATITDCVARTITTLNLRDKTYQVVSMDQPSETKSGGAGGGSMPKDDGTKVAIAVTNSALGARQVGGEPTNGFSSKMTFTETKPTGESHTQNADLVGYYASFAMPAPQCPRAGWAELTGGAGQGFGGMAAAAKLMQALRSAGMDSRFSITQSGPALPLGKFSMYQAMSFGTASGNAPSFITERGDVRSIDPNDPIFSVPSDFTKQP